MTASAGPGRPNQAPTSAGTALAFVPSKSAQADLEPQHSGPLGDRPAYSPGERLT